MSRGWVQIVAESPCWVTGFPVRPTRRTLWSSRCWVNAPMSSTYHAIECRRFPNRDRNRRSGVLASSGLADGWMGSIHWSATISRDASRRAAFSYAR